MYFDVCGYACYTASRSMRSCEVVLKNCYDYETAVSIGEQINKALNGTGVTITRVGPGDSYSIMVHGVLHEEVTKWQG